MSESLASASEIDIVTSVRLSLDSLKPFTVELMKSLYSMLIKAKLDTLISELMNSQTEVYPFPDCLYSSQFHLFTVLNFF